jgi:hypothetical protein
MKIPNKDPTEFQSSIEKIIDHIFEVSNDELA